MSAQLQVTGEAKIRDLQGPVVANSGVITALDGAASQYVRGDGTLADFPTATGGGSSVSYYLNGSVNQGTFGGSTYYQMSKNAITGAGTNFSTSSNGLLAQFITDANDPDQTSIPSGNWNIEFFMGVSASSGALASFYVEFYKYDGTNFTLLATNVATPEFLTGTTTVDAYFTSVAFAETPLATTDRLAIRIYANVASKTVTLYTEDNRLCQVVTTFSRGILSLNNLTDQQQYFAVGTSGTDFNIVSSLDTHTFNIPVASATNTGKLSSTDWSTFNNKVPYTGAIADVDLGNRNLSTTNTINTKTLNASQNAVLGGATIGGVQVSGVLTLLDFGSYILDDNNLNIYSTGVNSLNIRFGESSILYKDVKFSSSLITNTSERTFTFPDLSGTLALLEGSQTFSGVKTFSENVKIDAGIRYKKNPAIQTASAGYLTTYGTSGFGLSFFDGDSGNESKLAFNTASNYTYTFPASSGTIALTSNLSSYVPYTGATSDVNLGINRLYSTGLTLSTSATAFAPGLTTLNGNANGLTISLGTSSGGSTITYSNQFLFSTNVSNTYTFPNASGTVALTSNFDGYVPYTGATSSLNLGANNITTTGLATLKTIQAGTSTVAGVVALKSPGGVGFSFDSGSINLIASDPTEFRLLYGKGSGNSKSVIFSDTSLTLNTPRTYTLPDASGTIALTSNIPSVSGTSGQVTYFNGTSSVTGSSNHFWDATNNRLGIGLTNPQRSLEIYSATADSHLRLSGSAPSVSMGEAITGSVYQAKFGLATAAGQYVSGAVAGDFVMLSQTGATIFATSATEKMRLTSGGNLLVGTTSDNGAKLQVSGAATFSSSVTIGEDLTLNNIGTAASNILATSTSGILSLTAGATSGYTGGGTIELVANDRSGTNTRGEVYINAGNASANTANGFISLSTANTERLRVTYGGNVGIGTSSPQERFEVAGLNGNIRLYGRSGISNNTLSANIYYNGSAWVRDNGSFGAADINFSSSNDTIIFSTNPATSGSTIERMRITSGGNVLIGTTTDNGNKLQINGTIDSVGSSASISIQARDLSRKYAFYALDNSQLYLYNGSSNIGSFNASTGVYVALSDINKKKDFEQSTIGLNAILSLKPTLYRMKIEDESEEKHLGFIAQEVKEFIPQAYVDKNDFIGLDFNPIVATLVKAIQESHQIQLEQQAQIEELKELIKNK